jgi:hypothetical protein
MFKSFGFYWGLLICAVNTYVFFSSIFWASISGYPDGISMNMEILIEILFLLDVMIRIAVTILV